MANSLLNSVFQRLSGGAVLLTVAIACGHAPRGPAEAQPSSLRNVGGPESVLLRFPREGGAPRSYRWPAIDSAIWTGPEKLPALDRLLAFDDGGGLVAIVAADGRAGRVDLRNGRVHLTAKPLLHPASADGWSLYGINADGRVDRTTPTAEWKGPAATADTVFALPGGIVVLMTSEADQTRLVRFRPPSLKPLDSIKLPRVDALVRTYNADRLYARTARGIVAIDARTWRVVPGPRTGHRVTAIAPTPSGDRAFVLDEDGRTIRVWDRYAEDFSAGALLPRAATDLRMDPLGRYALARMANYDSAYVISVPLARVLATIATEWRRDLPTVSPAGAVLAVRGGDVLSLDAATGTKRLRIAGGASDLWMTVRWDGFLPRDSMLDAPVTFASETPADSAAAVETIDSLLTAHAATVSRDDSIAKASLATTGIAATRGRGGRRMTIDTVASTVYTLSFAAVLSESSARDLAKSIRVFGRQPRVVVGDRDGVKIYRVVLGPYKTREAAEAAGKRSGVPYWVFSGLP